MKAIQTVNLTKKYKDLTAVDNLCLQIEQGELFSLLGINGAGKTTLIKMLSCLSVPTSGDATIFEKSILHDGADIKRLVGVSPQETAVAPGLSVRENLELMCGIYGYISKDARLKVEELSCELGLDGVLSKQAGKLSGGYKRRLSIAMALISEPKLLFLDEPTLGLDVIARAELWELIRSIKKRTTIVLTTHYMEEAEALSDRVGIMNFGRLLVEGTPRELISRTGTNRLEDAFVSIVRGAGI